MVRIAGSRYDAIAEMEEISIEATPTQVKKLRRALLGDAWIRIANGKILVLPAHKPPLPLYDEALEGYFPSRKSAKPKYKQMLLFPKTGSPDGAAIYVQSITGYGPSAHYAVNAINLAAAGFECLRSRRDKGGQYWEIWYLPSPFSARGDIKGKTVEEIRSWLCQFIGPGHISIEGESWGASPD